MNDLSYCNFCFDRKQASEFLHRFRGASGLEETWDEIQRETGVAGPRQLVPAIQQPPLDGRLCLDWSRGLFGVRKCFLISFLLAFNRLCKNK